MLPWHAVVYALRYTDVFLESQRLDSDLNFEEITNLLIAVQVAIRVNYYERRGPISTDKVVSVIRKSFGSLYPFSDDCFHSHEQNSGSQNTNDRRRGVQSWSESLRHSDP